MISMSVNGGGGSHFAPLKMPKSLSCVNYWQLEKRENPNFESKTEAEPGPTKILDFM